MSTTTETAPETTEDAPLAPGHPDAVAAGCTCPAWINSYGDGLRSTIGADPEAESYLQHPDCRLHGAL